MPALVPRMSRSAVRDLRRYAWTGTTTFGVAAAPAAASTHKSGFFLTFDQLSSGNSSCLSSPLPFPIAICPQRRQRQQQKQQQPSQVLQLDRPRFYSSSPSDTKSSSSLIMASATSIYDFKPLDKRGQEVPMSDYKGKVLLIVNTASECGFTPQYAGLESLYKKLEEKYPDNFAILGFPCNQFAGQEPGTNDDIQKFCQVNYGVTFPIMGKTEVNGANAAPIWKWLKQEKPGIMGLKWIKWNFEKFLVGRDGQVKGRWASTTKPESLEEAIVEELEKKG